MRSLSLREVTAADVDLLYKWANDPVVRASAYSTGDIDYDTHVKWFNRKLNDPNCSIYILTDGETHFGQVRGDIDGEKTEIDYSIDANYRGQGLAKQMLLFFEEKATTNVLYAEVKKENVASQNVFKALEYSQEERNDIFVYMKRL